MKFPHNDIISLLDERLELNLAESTNQDLVLREIWDASFAESLIDLKLEYGTSAGNEQLRSLLATKLDVHKNDLVITNGAVFGIFLSILCLCKEGDEVLTVQPNFPPTMDLIDGLGFKKKILKLSFEENYQLNEELLFDSISANTKLIILVTPLNPTGTVLEKDQIEDIANRLEEEYPNCTLLVDETYREATYGNHSVYPTCSGLKSNIVTISSLSKCHGTPGLRIGWLCSTNSSFLQDVKTAKMNTVISNSVLDEFVALQVLKRESDIFRTRRIHAAEGLRRMEEWIKRNENWIEWIKPQAGALCCVKLRESAFDEDQISAFYSKTRQAGIQIANGTWFGESHRIFRLGFGYLSIDKLDKSLIKLTEIVSEIVS